MAKINGLSVPPGLITQYQSVLTSGFYNLNEKVQKRKYPVSYAKRISFANSSLFVKWQDLWGSFLSPRKLSWAVYWETLPFGAHSGTGGWPGSGYSAFVYVNAPRYMAGLELLLDPPSALGPELLYNGDFTDGLNGWETYGAVEGAVVIDNQYHFTTYYPSNVINAYQENVGFFGGPPFPTFRLTATYLIPSGVTCDDWYDDFYFPYNTILGFWNTPQDSSEIFQGIPITSATGDFVTISQDITYGNDPDMMGFSFGCQGMEVLGDIIISSVSLRQVL